MSDSKSGAGGNVTWIDFRSIKIGKKIGEGGFGAVFEAILNGNKQVAVKRFENPDQQTINREIKQLSGHSHPNIIKIYGASRDENDIYLVMELADNGSLYDVIHDYSRKPRYNRRVNWGLQCAKGVAYLHSKRIMHRDVKPGNCLLFQDEIVLKICDFGFARNEVTSGDWTATGGIPSLTPCGTPGYAAPEVWNGGQYKKKCDVYSWAIMMGELLTRKMPYPNAEVVKKRVSGVPVRLYDLLERCWAYKPSERPIMSEVVETMETF